MRKTQALCAFVVFWVVILANSSTFSANNEIKEWTFLIYINGHNDLDPYGAMDINEMEEVGSTDNINVVVQWASLESSSTKRLLIQKDSNTSLVTSPIIQDLGKQVDMGNYESLQEFIQWSTENYPARHYFIDVWNHGNGWKPKHRGEVKLEDISFDDLSGNAISTKQLGLVTDYAKGLFGHNVDMIGTDACLMSMIEVANEMSDSVEVFVGSEDLEPLKGWPYHLLLTEWANTPKATARDVSKILTRVYVEDYESQGESSITLSAFNLKKIHPLQTAIQDFALAITSLDRSTQSQLLGIIEKSTNFDGLEYLDIIDVLNQIKASNSTIMDQSIFDHIQKAVSQFVIANHYSKDYAQLGGVSFWFPKQRSIFDLYKDTYQTLKFNAATQWSTMLNQLLFVHR